MAKHKYNPANAVENLISIQKNCLCDNYMVGLYNGLVIAHSCITHGNSYALEDPLKKKNKVRYKK